jgi:hypothetical protein
MSRPPSALVRVVLLAGLLAGGASHATAQAAKSGSPPLDPSRLDLYGGYAYFHPQNSDINNIPYPPLQPGAVASASGFFNQYLGIELQGTYFPQSDGYHLVTGQTGPIVRFPLGNYTLGRFDLTRFVPFAHFLAGGARISGPAQQKETWGWGITGGIGLDYILPYLNDHLAIRPIQADFHYSQVDYGPGSAPNTVTTGGFGEIYAYRLSAGIVGRFGNAAPAYGPMLGCTAQPSSIYPGDPLTVSASSLNLKSNRRYLYQWTFANGAFAGQARIPGQSETIQLDTARLAPGDYAVNGRVLREKSTRSIATCTAIFTVRKVDPPTLTCAADPSTLPPGGQATLRALAVSPQNRTMTYSYQASAGQISGGGPTVTFSPGATEPGPVVLTCNVVDDLGQGASATALVTIATPPPPPAPPARPLCSVAFNRDRKRPDRVDNEAKGCLDDIALTLNRESGSKLLIVGRRAPTEANGDAAERALNVREYLVREKGVDTSRIELRIGDAAESRTVDNTLIPPGASYDPGPVSSFDASTIPRHGQPYGPAGTTLSPTPPRRRRKPTPPTVAQPTVP